MSDTVIKVENFSKIYRVGVPVAIRRGSGATTFAIAPVDITGTISHSLSRFGGISTAGGKPTSSAN